MPRLKDRNRQIPNGFRFTQPQTNWNAPPWSSFDTLVKTIIAHRKGNAHIARKHHLAIDYVNVANEVDSFNAEICAAQGWDEFILSEAAPPKLWPLPQLLSVADFAGASVRIA